MSDETHPFRDWDASYVLGMLGAEDRRRFEDHLATCAQCRDAVTELAGLPGMLARLPAREAVELVDVQISRSPLPDLAARLAHLVDRRRRRGRVRAGALAAAGIAAAAAVAVLVTLGVATPTTPAETAMQQVVPHTVTAAIAVTPKAWGTRLDWHCSYATSKWATPVSYDLVVTTREGSEDVVATWAADGAVAQGLSASTAVPASDIRAVDIRVTGSDTTLATTRF